MVSSESWEGTGILSRHVQLICPKATNWASLTYINSFHVRVSSSYHPCGSLSSSKCWLTSHTKEGPFMTQRTLPIIRSFRYRCLVISNVKLPRKYPYHVIHSCGGCPLPCSFPVAIMPVMMSRSHLWSPCSELVANPWQDYDDRKERVDNGAVWF